VSALKVMLPIGALVALAAAGIFVLNRTPAPPRAVPNPIAAPESHPPALTNQPDANPSPRASAAVAPAASTPAPNPSTSPATSPEIDAPSRAPQQPAASVTPPERVAPASPSPPLNTGAKKQKPPIADPIARQALALVGTDDLAEMYWLDAINDPTLGPEERSDLIEDLNQDGFADPKNLGPQDLPLILSRLSLIEQHAPSAMDQVNADAFKEAYKDLLAMHARLMQP